MDSVFVSELYKRALPRKITFEYETFGFGKKHILLIKDENSKEEALVYYWLGVIHMNVRDGKRQFGKRMLYYENARAPRLGGAKELCKIVVESLLASYSEKWEVSKAIEWRSMLKRRRVLLKN